MKPDKAIFILQQSSEYEVVRITKERRDAFKLGAEALEFFQEFQKVTGGRQDARLPSETED